MSLGYKHIIGTDEAGRGPGAGPVVAAAVLVPKDLLPQLVGKVNDSKKMTSTRREELFHLIKDNCPHGIKSVGADVIDEINILEATKLAMQGAIDQLPIFDFILIDGTVDLKKHVLVPQKNVIKGDTLSVSIAAASILAKVTRDRTMEELHEVFPVYNWQKNKGYLTKDHCDAIKLYGITEFHRVSFRRVGK